jgi:hypothetical protein
MYGASVPRPRSRFLPFLVARWVWTLPTNLIGHTVGCLACRRLPRRLKGPAGAAWLYLLPVGSLLRRAGVVAIGHVVLAESTFVSGDRGRWVLAHEMSHSRQHDWLGPAYLPLHVLFQVMSIVLNRVRPVQGVSALHAYNPLERILLHVPFDVLLEAEKSLSSGDPRVLSAFGLRRWPPL